MSVWVETVKIKLDPVLILGELHGLTGEVTQTSLVGVRPAEHLSAPSTVLVLGSDRPQRVQMATLNRLRL